MYFHIEYTGDNFNAGYYEIQIVSNLMFYPTVGGSIKTGEYTIEIIEKDINYDIVIAEHQAPNGYGVLTVNPFAYKEIGCPTIDWNVVIDGNVLNPRHFYLYNLDSNQGAGGWEIPASETSTNYSYNFYLDGDIYVLYTYDSNGRLVAFSDSKNNKSFKGWEPKK